LALRNRKSIAEEPLRRSAWRLDCGIGDSYEIALAEEREVEYLTSSEE
jgi:hypothetical protein